MEQYILQLADPKTVMEVRTTAMEDHKQVVGVDIPVMEDHKPVVGVDIPVMEDHKPLMEDHTPVMEIHAPIMEDHITAMEDHKPVVGIDIPVMEDHKPLMEYHIPVMGVYTPAKEVHTPVMGVHTVTPVMEVHTPVMGVHTVTPVMEIHTPVMGIPKPGMGVQTPFTEVHKPVMEDKKNFAFPSIPNRFVEEAFLKSGGNRNELHRIICGVTNMPSNLLESINKSSLYTKVNEVMKEIKRLKKFRDKNKLNSYLCERFEFPKRRKKKHEDKNVQDLSSRKGGSCRNCIEKKTSESKQIEHLLKVNEELREKIGSIRVNTGRMNRTIKRKEHTIDRLKIKIQILIKEKKLRGKKERNRQERGAQCNILRVRTYKKPLFVKSTPLEKPVAVPNVQIVKIEPGFEPLYACPGTVMGEVKDGNTKGMQVTEEELCSAVNSTVNGLHGEGSLNDTNINIPVHEPSVSGESLDTVPMKKQKLDPEEQVQEADLTYAKSKPELWSNEDVTNAEMEKILTRREQSVAIRKQIQLLSVSFAVEEEDTQDKHLCRLSGKEYDIETLKENFLSLLGIYKRYLCNRYSILCGNIEELVGRELCHIVWKEDGTDPVIWTGKIMCISLRRRLLQVDIELLFPLSIRYKCNMN